MVSGSNPPSDKLSLRVKKSPAFCNSRRRNHEVRSRREEGPGQCSISKNFSVPISNLNIYIYIYRNENISKLTPAKHVGDS